MARNITINLTDNASGGITAVGQALQNLRKVIEDSSSSLGELETGLGGMGKLSSSSIQQTTQGMGKLSAASAKSGAGVEAWSQTMRGSVGPMGGMLERIGALVKGLGATGLAGGIAAGAGIIIAASIGIVAALGAVVAKMFEFGLATSDAARTQNIMMEAMTGSAESATALGGSIDRVAKGTTLATDKIRGYAKDLYKAGLRGNELEDALMAASMAAQFDEAGASSFVKQMTAAKAAGESVSALSAKMKGKFAGPTEKLMLGFTQQLAKAKQNVGRLFTGLAIEPFLKGLATVLELLDESTASGAAFKTLIGTILNPLFAAAGAIAPVVKDVFRGMIVAALQTAIVVLTLRNELMAFAGISGSLSWLPSAFDAGRYAAYAVLAVLGLIGIALAGIAVSIAFAMIPFVLFGAIVVGAVLLVVAAVYGLVSAFVGAYDFIAGLDFGGLASDLISGLASGITAGADIVIQAVKSLALSMKGALKGALGISSPSKVFASYGVNTTEGFTHGLEQGKTDVDKAVTGLVSPPPTMGEPASNAVAGAASSAASVQRVLNVTINGVEGAEKLLEPSFAEQLAIQFELAAQMAGV